MKIIYENEKKIRVDKFLSSNSSLTRNKVIRFISQRKVKVNGIVVKKASILLKYKDEIIIDKPDYQAPKKDLVSDYNLKIKYEDDDLLIISNEPDEKILPLSTLLKILSIDLM